MAIIKINNYLSITTTDIPFYSILFFHIISLLSYFVKFAERNEWYIFNKLIKFHISFPIPILFNPVY